MIHSRITPIRCGSPTCNQLLLGLGAAAAALSLSALRAVLFLDADEAQTTSMLAEDSAALDGLIESTEKLIKALVISNLNTHKPESPPYHCAYFYGLGATCVR